MNRKYKLRVELEDFEGERRWAEYSTFYVNPVTDNYRLTVGGYSGDAGTYVQTVLREFDLYQVVLLEFV